MLGALLSCLVCRPWGDVKTGAIWSEVDGVWRWTKPEAIQPRGDQAEQCGEAHFFA